MADKATMSVQALPSRRLNLLLAGLTLAGVLLACAAVGVTRAAAATPVYRGASALGDVVFFETEEQLVPGDTDTKRDVYERSFDESVGAVGAYVTREVSTGPTGGNDGYDVLFENTSADGNLVFFSTHETLVAADKDAESDVYVRDLKAETTRLVSQGVSDCGCGNGPFDAGFAAATADGEEVFFATAEKLDPAADTDNSFDVYERDLGASTETTSLVSMAAPVCSGTCGNSELGATLWGVSANGSKAFFATSEPLVDGDTDSARDVYAHSLPGGPTTLVSAGDPLCSPCGNSNTADAVFVGSSADGSRAFFATNEPLVPDDNDGANDIYQRAGGVTTLVSGTAPDAASFAAASGDGSRVFFFTSKSLVGAADSNDANDVYMWEEGAPQLITSGKGSGSTFGAVSADAEKVFFTTNERLSLSDGDDSQDIYEQDVAGGAPVLVSAGDLACSPCGNGAIPALFKRASADGSRVFFSTDEQLSSEDSGSDDDIYLRDLTAGTTTLATPPPGTCPVSPCDAIFLNASVDATHLFFQTTERLANEDKDSDADVYERAFGPGLGAGVTRLVSTGNSSDLDLGPAPPVLQGTTPASPAISLQPAIFGQAKAGSLIKIYSNENCSREPVATGTAEELADPGIAVEVDVGSTTSFWATAEAEGFTSLCSNHVTYKQGAPGPSAPNPTQSGAGGSVPAAGTGSRPAKTHDGVPYVAPQTRITFGPASKTRARRPVFRFTDTTGQPGTRFRCRLDRGRWRSCSSPTKVKRLRRGRHKFRVKGINAVGTPEARPASRTFKVAR